MNTKALSLLVALIAVGIASLAYVRWKVMTIKDINDIIKAVCPNDEDYDKPIISPKYLRQELEQLALEQEHKHIEPTTKNDLVTLTFSKGTLKYSCKDYVVYKKDWLRSHYGAEIDIMFGDSQYKEPTTKNDLGVDCINRQDVLSEIIRFSTEEGSSVECQQLYCDVYNMPSVTPQLCEDAISRQATVKAVMQNVSDKRTHEFNAGVTRAANSIKLLPPVTPQPRWIPVSERLPNTDDEVLCWYEYYHWSREKVLPEYGLGRYLRETSAWSGEVAIGIDVRVIAWMPLPEPYKAESEK